jgi:hypothetical protein
MNAQGAFSGDCSPFLQVLLVFIHVSTWQAPSYSFTVTAMSGNATTFAWSDAADDLTVDEAAALLGIPPAALERWARQLAFPHELGPAGGTTTRFKRAEIEALRDALVSAHSVEGAVRAARDRSES